MGIDIAFTLVAVTAYVAAIGRVLTYRRNGARHRHHVSWLAWLFVAVMGGSTIGLALHTRPAGLLDAATAVLLALFSFGARGNVARLIRSSFHDSTGSQ